LTRKLVVVVSGPGDLPGVSPERVLTADRYLAGGDEVRAGASVINLCRSYRYGTKGYYVSLLGEARGHRVIPTVEAIEGLADPFALARVLREAGVATVQAIRARPAGGHGRAEALCFFGHCSDARFRSAAQALYREWPTPVLRIQTAEEEGEWKVAHAVPIPLRQLGSEDLAKLAQAISDERRVMRRARPAPPELKRASLAVLFDEEDPFSPSSPETIDRLARVAGRMNVHLQRIGLDDIERVGEYDALFIRTLTGVREPSFQFALRAEMLDMPVIDDPPSIIRCSNKVFLEELLRREAISTPHTLVVTSHTPWQEVAALGLPVVVKLPDGSFSAAVHKCDTREDFVGVTAEMFRRSPLLIAQEFLPTEYDWRITVLGGRVLFAARYFMARGHWQIRSAHAGSERYGRVEAVPRASAPAGVVELALRAASLIGNGLYGVDIKETPAGPAIIEINDNPNLDVGYDDAADGNLVYEDLVSYFLERIEESPPAEERTGSLTPRAQSSRRATAHRHYRPFQVAGLELEYAVVDRDLNAVSLVEDAFRAITGRPTSDIELERCGFSNEIADHVFEVKTLAPTRRLRDAEDALVEGIGRFSEVLRSEFGARLLPTGMHPWLDPGKARLWTRSNSRIYQAYARLFDVHTHGWLNVHAAHLNLPLGRERDAVALYNASALLIPYLPALAASSPMHDGELQVASDNRLRWMLEHQARVPESCGVIVPEYVTSLSDYRRRILGGMYRALDRLPDAGVLRHEFFNARGAVMKFSRKALEIRVLDTQECVKLDVAVAVFARSALRFLAHRLAAGRLPLPDHAALVADFQSTVRDGSEARVLAPYLPDGVDRDQDGRAPVRAVLRWLLEQARRAVRREDPPYLDLVARMIETGTLSERIRAHLLPHVGDDERFTEAARRIYIELGDSLDANEPWRGRGL
jgi:glutathione synthase/RimK-type ligase-like ATP-grasp enzyme